MGFNPHKLYQTVRIRFFFAPHTMRLSCLTKHEFVPRILTLANRLTNENKIPSWLSVCSIKLPFQLAYDLLGRLCSFLERLYQHELPLLLFESQIL